MITRGCTVTRSNYFNMKTEANFIKKFFIYLTNTTGNPLSRGNGSRYFKYWKYYLLYAFWSVTGGQLLMLAYVSSLNDICIAIVFIASGLFYNSTTLVLHLKNEVMNDILRCIMSDFIKFTPKDAQSANSKFRKFFFTYGIVYMLVYTLSLLSPALLFPISNKKFSDINALLVPCVFPWKIDTYLKYMLTIFLQISWLLPLSVPVLLNFMFSIYFIFEVRTQFAILRRSLLVAEFSTIRSDVDEERVLQCFAQSIRHYQAIVRFITLFKACYNKIFATNLLYSLVAISLLLLVIASGEQNFSSIVRGIASFFTVTFYLFVYCYIGQVLQDENEFLRIALYDMKWYDSESKKFQKILSITMHSAARILSLRTGYLYIASFELFFNMLKMSYSYYNIIAGAFGR